MKRSASVDTVRTLTVANREKIEELRQWEIVQMREEIEIIHNRPVQGQYIQPTDNRDVINFKNYKKNPIEFLERIDENLTRIRENRWTVTVSYTHLRECSHYASLADDSEEPCF